MKAQCRKARYADRGAALAAARSMSARTGTRLSALEAYQCKLGCTVDHAGKRAWHYGHRIGSRRKPKLVRR